MTRTQSEDNMTSGWKTVKLEEIADYVREKVRISQLDESTYVSTENMLPNKGGIVPASTLPTGTLTQAFKCGDVLVSNIRPYFKKIWFATFDGGCSADVLVFRAKSGIDSSFLRYALSNDSFFAHSMASSKGTKMPRGDKQSIMRYEVPDVPLDVQRRIAAVLKPLDDKIELNARINARLERVAQTLFKRHFVRFEPYGGTMPPGWRVGTLSEIAHITMGQSPAGKSYNDKGIGTVFFQGRTDFGFRFPTMRLFTTEPKRMAKKRDVLLSVRAPVGDVNEAHEDCCIGRGLAAIQSKNGCQSFLLYTMFSLKKQLEVFNAEGTVFGCINRDSLNAMPILIPTDNAIKEFERIIAPMDKMIRSNTDESRTLARLRDVLLPRLMSGAVDVRQVNLNSIQKGGSR